MDPILQTLLSWQFLIFGVAVAAIMFVLRKIVEYLMANWAPATKESKLWNELLLPILPVVLGSVGALVFKTYPYPDNLTTSGSRFIFGLVAGLLSTLFYRVIKALLVQKIQIATQVINPTPVAPPVVTNGDAPPDPVADGKDLVNQVRQSINKS